MSSHGLRIAFFGASLVSAWWNGAAMYYRGLLRALHARGHQITFYEPAHPERQRHRDLPVAPRVERAEDAPVVHGRPVPPGRDEARAEEGDPKSVAAHVSPFP